MERKKEILVDSFTDYSGKIHKFVIVGITEPLGTKNSPVVIYSDIYDTKCLGTVSKGLKIGVAVCNPEDEFNQEEGIKLATKRAEESDFVLYSTNKGQMNNVLINSFLKQESNYIKKNPNKYIKGYTDSKIKYFDKLNKEKEVLLLDDKEKEIYYWLLQYPECSDKIIKCLQNH